jgi:hypothetical protein
MASFVVKKVMKEVAKRGVVKAAKKLIKSTVKKVKKAKVEKGIKKLTKSGAKEREKGNSAARKRLAEAKKTHDKKQKAKPKGKSSGTKDYKPVKKKGSVVRDLADHPAVPVGAATAGVAAEGRRRSKKRAAKKKKKNK